MCRINGIFKPNSLNLKLDICSIGFTLRDLLSHGGPDDQGNYFSAEEGLFMGHRRLSILDTSSAGHQPMEFNNWVIVYNGEVYNFISIKEELKLLGYTFETESDTEVIIRAFDHWGNDAVNRFRGMFAFALWNKSTQTLLLCRDRLGVKPLYYYQDENFFIFASELKAITKFPGIDLEIDHSAISRYLQVGYIKSPYSIYKKVKKLAPGTFLEINRNGLSSISKYWDLQSIKPGNLNESDEQVLEKANSLLLENCKLRMVSDVPVGVFLSGGIDSSLVTAILSKDLGYQLNTFSIGFDHKDFDESTHAKKIAEYLGTDHHEWILNDNDFLEALDKFYTLYDEPFGDSSGIPTYLLSKFAKSKVTVALSADGGDEIFGGYDRYRIASSAFDKFKYLPLLLRKKIAEFLLETNAKNVRSFFTSLNGTSDKADLDWRLPKLLNLLGAESLADCYTRTQTSIPNYLLKSLHLVPLQSTLEEEEGWIEKSSLFSSFGKIDVASYLEGDILTKVDRATMAVALEGREPLLDHSLVEFGLSLPDHQKVRNGKNKWVLRTLLEKKIPTSLFDRPKKGFGVPIHAWMTTHLSSSILEMANNNDFHQKFLFDGMVFKKIIEQYLSQKSFINPHFVWNLHMLYIWYQKNLKHA
jgi:asparagine synthase (glutamine-hydrolysing)